MAARTPHGTAALACRPSRSGCRGSCRARDREAKDTRHSRVSHSFAWGHKSCAQGRWGQWAALVTEARTHLRPPREEAAHQSPPSCRAASPRKAPPFPLSSRPRDVGRRGAGALSPAPLRFALCGWELACAALTGRCVGAESSWRRLLREEGQCAWHGVLRAHRRLMASPAALIISVNFPLIGSKPISPNPNAHWHASARDVRGEVGSRRFLRGRGRDRRKPAPGAGGVALGAGGERRCQRRWRRGGMQARETRVPRD